LPDLLHGRSLAGPVRADPRMTGREVEQRHVDILCEVKDAVTVPVAVKLGPQFSSPGEVALRLDEVGADCSRCPRTPIRPPTNARATSARCAARTAPPGDVRILRTGVT